MTTYQIKTRWQTCLHEAGHAIAFKTFNPWNEKITAYVTDSGGWAESPRRINDAKYAIGIAAGKHAEKLIHRFKPPRRRPPPPTPPTPEGGATAAQIRDAAVFQATIQRIRRGPDDAELLARICIKYAPDDPADWTQRHRYFNTEARELVRTNATEIYRIAKILFRTGIYIHQGNAEF